MRGCLLGILVPFLLVTCSTPQLPGEQQTMSEGLSEFTTSDWHSVLSHWVTGHLVAAEPPALSASPHVSPQVLVGVLNDLTSHKLIISPTRLSIPAWEPPALEENSRYSVILLRCVSRLGMMTSLNFGGVVFEDPLTALAIAKMFAATSQGAVPEAGNFSELVRVYRSARSWLEKPSQDDGVPGFTYCEPEYAKHPPFEVLTVEGRSLRALRDEGSITHKLSGGLVLLQMYQKPVR